MKAKNIHLMTAIRDVFPIQMLSSRENDNIGVHWKFNDFFRVFQLNVKMRSSLGAEMRSYTFAASKERNKNTQMISMMPKNLCQLNVVVSVCGFMGHGKKNIEIALKFSRIHLDIFQMRNIRPTGASEITKAKEKNSKSCKYI